MNEPLDELTRVVKELPQWRRNLGDYSNEYINGVKDACALLSYLIEELKKEIE